MSSHQGWPGRFVINNRYSKDYQNGERASGETLRAHPGPWTCIQFDNTVHSVNTISGCLNIIGGYDMGYILFAVATGHLPHIMLID